MYTNPSVSCLCRKGSDGYYCLFGHVLVFVPHCACFTGTTGLLKFFLANGLKHVKFNNFIYLNTVRGNYKNSGLKKPEILTILAAHANSWAEQEGRNFFIANLSNSRIPHCPGSFLPAWDQRTCLYLACVWSAPCRGESDNSDTMSQWGGGIWFYQNMRPTGKGKGAIFCPKDLPSQRKTESSYSLSTACMNRSNSRTGP